MVVDRGDHADALVDAFATRSGLVIQLGPLGPSGRRGVTTVSRPRVVHFRLDPETDIAWSAARAAAMYLTGRLDIVVDAVSSAAWGTYAAVESPAKPDVVLEQALNVARPDGRPPSVLRVVACRATESSVAARYAIERWSPSQPESIASTDERPHHIYSRSEQLHCSPVDIFQLALESA